MPPVCCLYETMSGNLRIPPYVFFVTYILKRLLAAGDFGQFFCGAKQINQRIRMIKWYNKFDFYLSFCYMSFLLTKDHLRRYTISRRGCVTGTYLLTHFVSGDTSP